MPYVLLLLFAQILTPDEFGQLVFLTSLSYLLAHIIAFGSPAYLRRIFVDNPELMMPLLDRVSHIMIGLAAIIALGVAVFYFFGGQIFGFSLVWILAAIVLALLRAVFYAYSAPIQMSEQSLLSASMNIFISLFGGCAVIGFVLVANAGWGSRIAGELSVFIIFTIFMLFMRRRFLPTKAENVNITNHIEIFRNSLPIGIGLTLNIAFTTSDRFLLSAFFDFEAVAVYSFALQIAGLLGIVSMAMQQAYTPRIFRFARNRQFLALAGTLSTVGLFMALLGLVIYHLFQTSLEWQIWGQYNTPNAYLPLTITLTILNGFLVLLTSVNIYFQQGRFILLVQLAGFMFNITISVALIETYGSFAVLYGSIAASSLMILATSMSALRAIQTAQRGEFHETGFC